MQELIQTQPPSRLASVRAGDDSADNRVWTAAHAAPVMIWMAAADRRFDWFNAAWESFTGLGVEELAGDGWLRLIHPEDTDRYCGILANSYEARQPFVLDYRLLRHDGQYRAMLDNGVPRFDAQGGFAGYIGSVVDIHERRLFEERLADRTQALRLAERRQGAFLAMLSHELRNPLAPIANAASVLRTLEGLNPVLVRLREILERQVGRLSHLVDDLIDVTRSAHGQISLISEHLSVESLVHGAVAAGADQLNGAGHTLDVQMPEMPLYIKGDLARLTQALSNLISNAAKFSHEPSVLTLAVREANGNVEISVRDNGQGIAPEFLPHVFELFAQEDQSVGRKPGGLGVGLTLARRIVKLHNGDIQAFSDGPGQGASFVVTLPGAQAESEVEGNERRDSEREDGERKDSEREGGVDLPQLSESYRVLIVEDDAEAHEALRVQVEMWGNEVRLAGSAEEALEAAAAFKPHIVLCDIGLSGLESFDLLTPLRALLTEQRAMVAAVIGHTRQVDEARALAAGYDSFLVKPLQPGCLARLLRSYASGAR